MRFSPHGYLGRFGEKSLVVPALGPCVVQHVLPAEVAADDARGDLSLYCQGHALPPSRVHLEPAVPPEQLPVPPTVCATVPDDYCPSVAPRARQIHGPEPTRYNGLNGPGVAACFTPWGSRLARADFLGARRRRAPQRGSAAKRRAVVPDGQSAACGSRLALGRLTARAGRAFCVRALVYAPSKA